VGVVHVDKMEGPEYVYIHLLLIGFGLEPQMPCMHRSFVSAPVCIKLTILVYQLVEKD